MNDGDQAGDLIPQRSRSPCDRTQREKYLRRALLAQRNWIIKNHHTCDFEDHDWNVSEEMMEEEK